MKFKNREEIKAILEMNISNSEKKNLIANLKNYKGKLVRTIATNYELDIDEGQIWNIDEAESWAKYGNEFVPETEGKYIYSLVTEDEIEGYEVQYFDFDNLFNKFYIDEDMSEEESEKAAEELAEDKVYLELMDLLGSSGDMEKEQEILVPKTKLKIKEINDGREDVGYIEIILEVL